MKRMMLFLAVMAVLSGCASKGHWYKPDMTTFDGDISYCEAMGRYAYIIYPPNQPQYVLEGFDQGIFNRCMKYRSYEWVREEEQR